MNEILINSAFPLESFSIGEQSFIKILFLSIISKNNMVLYDIIEFTEKMIRKSNFFFKPNVYDLIKSSHFYLYFTNEKSIFLKKNTNELFEMNYTIFCEFQFFINQHGVLSKMQRLFFYNYNKLLYLPSVDEISVNSYLNQVELC